MICVSLHAIQIEKGFIDLDIFILNIIFLFYESLQMIASRHHFRNYLFNVWNILDWLRLLYTFAFCIIE